MNKRFFLPIVVLLCLLIFMVSCKKEADCDNSQRLECVFVQNDDDMDGLIDETERQIMQDCASNQITDRETLKSNLIGTWDIVGYG